MIQGLVQPLKPGFGRLLGTLAILSFFLLQAFPAFAEQRLERVRSWAYWLQDPDPRILAASPYDLVVMDYSRDGSDGGAFTAGEIHGIRSAGKVVLAYVSIGEAENYRFYWKPDSEKVPPPYLGPENPEWAGNFKVQYWMEAWWRDALRPYLDRVLAAGYDGVYLDIIDAYWFWGKEKGLGTRLCADRMIDLVRRIALYTRTAAGPDFLLCPQNGLSVIDDASPGKRERFVKAVDMVAVEDLFYHVSSKDDRTFTLNLLEKFASGGKLVLNVEYIPEKEYDSYLKSVRRNKARIIPYASSPDRSLKTLTRFLP